MDNLGLISSAYRERSSCYGHPIELICSLTHFNPLCLASAPPTHLDLTFPLSPATMLFTSALVLLSSSYLILQVTANTGYIATCNSLYLLSPISNRPYWTIVANCREPSGVYNVDTVINIDSCFINVGGRLVAQLKPVAISPALFPS